MKILIYHLLGGEKLELRVFCPFDYEKWIRIPDWAARGERNYTQVYWCSGRCKEAQEGRCRGGFVIHVVCGEVKIYSITLAEKKGII